MGRGKPCDSISRYNVVRPIFQFQLGPALVTPEVQAGSIEKGQLTYVNMRPAGALWGPAHGVHVSEAAGPLPAWKRLMPKEERRGAKLLILDPLAAAYTSNENDRAERRKDAEERA